MSVNPRNFLINSDYPMDKVVYIESVSFSAKTDGTYHTIAHGLDFVPLVSGSWSTSSDFSVNYDYGTGTIPSSNTSIPFNLALYVFADATNVYIVPSNITGSAQTVYCRIFGFEPSDSNADVPHTALEGSTFIFNSDNNYTKLYLDDALTNVTSSFTQTIVHDLGVVPQLSTWVTSSSVLIGASFVFLEDVTYPLYATSIVSGSPEDVSVVVTTTSVTFTTGASSLAERIDYRIYVDETS